MEPERGRHAIGLCAIKGFDCHEGCGLQVFGGFRLLTTGYFCHAVCNLAALTQITLNLNCLGPVKRKGGIKT